MSDHSELVRRLHESLCRKFIDNAWDAVVNGVVKNYGSTPRDIVEAWFSAADEERIEAANAIVALQAQIARLTAEHDAAIAEIGVTARARRDDVWNEAIAVTLRTIPQPLTTSHVAWLTYQNAIKAVARLKR